MAESVDECVEQCWMAESMSIGQRDCVGCFV